MLVAQHIVDEDYQAELSAIFAKVRMNTLNLLKDKKTTEPTPETLDLMLQVADILEAQGFSNRMYLTCWTKLMFATAHLTMSSDEVDAMLLEVLAVDRVPSAA